VTITSKRLPLSHAQGKNGLFRPRLRWRFKDTEKKAKEILGDNCGRMKIQVRDQQEREGSTTRPENDRELGGETIKDFKKRRTQEEPTKGNV